MAARRQDIGPPAAGPPEDLREVVAVARTVVAQEAQLTESIESKGRQLVGLAAQWFAIVQAALAVALNNDGVDHRWLLWAAAAVAVLGGLALGAVAVLGWQVWRVRRIDDVTPRGLLDMRDYSKTRDDSVLSGLVEYHAHILQVRRRVNAERAMWSRRLQVAWFVAMALPLAELGFALAAYSSHEHDAARGLGRRGGIGHAGPSGGAGGRRAYFAGRPRRGIAGTSLHRARHDHRLPRRGRRR